MIREGEPTCMSLVRDRLAAHLGYSLSDPVGSLWELVQQSRSGGVAVAMHQHWIGMVLPTGFRFRMALGAMHMSSRPRFLKQLERVKAKRRPYAVVALSPAHAFYEEPRPWTHSVAFLGTKSDRITIYDPIHETDPELGLRLKRRTIESLAGRLDTILALFWRTGAA